MFILLTLVDRITKCVAAVQLAAHDVILIPGVLEFHYLENRGAAWGILQNQFWLLMSITLVVIVILTLIYLHLPYTKRFHFFRFSLVLLTAGAIGNLVDRAVNRYVVDFIYFSLIDFPVFNIADCYVCISAVLILYCLLFRYQDEEFKISKEDA